MGIGQDPDQTAELKPLLVQARAGDGEAFCRLMEPLEGRLFQQALALCRDTPTAEDLVSETLVEAWKGLARYDETCRLTTWLYSILLHRYQKNVRRLRSRPVSLAALPAQEAVLRYETHCQRASADPSPAESAMQTEVNRELRQMIEGLAEKHKQVVLLRFFEGASLGEMALVLKCSAGTVKSRMHHALKHLRRTKNSMNLFSAIRDT